VIAEVCGPLAVQVASCYRRIGAIPQALAKYKEIHSSHPDNIECLRYLVHLCTDLGRRDDAHEYLARLRRAERTQVHRCHVCTRSACSSLGLVCAAGQARVVCFIVRQALGRH
jgi:Tetratricopeptide repeat